MKYIFIVLMMSFAQNIKADIDKCIHDAPFHGTSAQLMTHSQECPDLIMNHPEAKVIRSKDKKISVYALANMIYVSTPDESGLIAGSQTRLTRITSISMHEDEKILLVYQNYGNKSSILQFILGETGNVVPGKYLEGQSLADLSSVKLKPQDKEIELLSSDGKTTVLSSEGDSRHGKDQPEFRPRVLRVHEKQKPAHN